MCASWAAAPPNSLRYHSSSKQLALSLLSPLSPPSQKVHPALWPQGEGPAHWEDSISLCVLVQPAEAQVPGCCAEELGEFLVVGAHRCSEFCFPLTTVDGRRPDDISVGVLQRQHSCFRSLFEGERCPAPFTHGSLFFCFHCLGGEPALSHSAPLQAAGGRPSAAPPQQAGAALCARPETEAGSHVEEDGRREEKLALMYERLRVQVRSQLCSAPV